MADSKQLWFHTRLSGKVYPEQCCWVGCLRLVCAGEGRGGVLFVDARSLQVVLIYSPHAHCGKFHFFALEVQGPRCISGLSSAFARHSWLPLMHLRCVVHWELRRSGRWPLISHLEWLPHRSTRSSAETSLSSMLKRCSQPNRSRSPPTTSSPKQSPSSPLTTVPTIPRC